MTPRPIASAVALACLFATALPATRRQATFRARREIVRIDVLVTEHNQPISGLGPADFQVLDNGVPQDIDMMRAGDLPINVVLALDLSGSVTGDRLEHLRNASHALLGALVKDDRAALIGFSHRVELGAALTTDLPSVAASLGRTHAGGGTALYDATYAGLVLGEADAGRSLLIVFSDGLDTSSFLAKDAVLDVARRSAAVVYGVTVGDRTPVFLNDVTSLTGGSVFLSDSTRDLDKLFIDVLSEFRHRYLLAYAPQGVAKDGWHRIDVTVKTRKGLTIKARPGYQAGS